MNQELSELKEQQEADLIDLFATMPSPKFIYAEQLNSGLGKRNCQYYVSCYLRKLERWCYKNYISDETAQKVILVEGMRRISLAMELTQADFRGLNWDTASNNYSYYRRYFERLVQHVS